MFFQGQDRTTTRYRDLMMGRAGGSGERRGEEGLGRRGKIYEVRNTGKGRRQGDGWHWKLKGTCSKYPSCQVRGGAHYSVLTCATATATATFYCWYRSYATYVHPVAAEKPDRPATNYTGPKMSKPSPPLAFPSHPKVSLLYRSTAARHAHRQDWTEMAVCQSVTAGLRCLDETK